MSIENKKRASAGSGERVIEQTVEERIRDLESERETLEAWMATNARTREDGERLEQIKARIKELRGY